MRAVFARAVGGWLNQQVNVLHPALAVQCFYIISGFYVQLIIAEKYGVQGGDWKWNFYKSRIFRIFPAYYFFALAGMLVASHKFLFNDGGPAELLADGNYSRFFLWLFTGLFLFTENPFGIYRPLSTAGWVIGSWTLSIELIFYALAPWLLRFSTKRLLLLAVAAAALRFAGAYWEFTYPHQFHAVFPNPPLSFSWLYGFLPSELGLFLCGSLGYRFYAFFLKRPCANPVRRTLVSALIAGWFVWFLYEGWNHYPGAWGEGALGVPVRYWFVLLVAIIGVPFLFHCTRNWKWDRAIGELSYPLYLGHVVVWLALDRWATIPKEYMSAYVLPATLVAAFGVYWCVERPIDRWRHRKFSGAD